MDLPVIVDIAIGLVFIYLLLSLLASEVQELISTVLQWRAKHLKDSVINLFADDVYSEHSIEKAKQLTKQVYQHPLIRSINQESLGVLPNFFRGITWVASRIYRLLTAKEEGEFGPQRSAPSYIPKEAFATALLEQLGTKHFVERLVEAKFSDFIDSTNNKVISLLQKDNEGKQKYTRLIAKFAKIEQEFIDKKIDLESAISSISEKLDIFLGQLDDDPDNNDLEELIEWKNRVFIKDINKLIANAGLKPTLQEIVESIDKGSKTYNTYKERFRQYEQKRYQEVYHDLARIEKFLNIFLEELIKKHNEELRKENRSNNERAIHDQQIAPPDFTIKELHKEFFSRKDIPSKPNPKTLYERTQKPLSRIDEIIAVKLENIQQDQPLTHKNPASLKLRGSLYAFQEGMTGKNHLSKVQHFLLFEETFFSRTIPSTLFLLLGLLLALGLAELSILGELAQNWLVSYSGGLIALAILILLPFICFSGSRLYFAHQKRKKRKFVVDQCSTQEEFFPGSREYIATKSLAGIFDDFFLSEELSADEILDSQQMPSWERQRKQIIAKRVIEEKIRLIYLEPKASLYKEMKDLGSSFNRYFSRFSLENADIDLAFIPNSVKQSLAVLIRRSKTIAKQAEDQILHLKTEVEGWYDQSMERATGVYKRNAKGISIFIGFILAVAINANSIHILDQLAFDQELRQAVVAAAVEQVGASNQTAESSQTEESPEEAASTQTEESSQTEESPQAADSSPPNEAPKTEESPQAAGTAPPNEAPQNDEFMETISGINLPIGWDPALIDDEFNCKTEEEPGQKNNTLDNEWNQLLEACIYGKTITNPENSLTQQEASNVELRTLPSNEDIAAIDTNFPPERFFYPTAIAAIFLSHPLTGLKFLLGWIITGIAISMGATFWFDLLGKLVNVRNTGKQPQSTGDNPSAVESKPASPSK